MELNLLYCGGEQIGYGRMGTELAKALGARGINIVENLHRPPGVETPANEVHSDGPGHPCNVVASLSWPTHLRGWFEDQHTVAFTMFESTELPEQMRAPLHNFSQVLVPCEANRELFSQFHADVRVVPLGVNPDVWHYTPRKPPGQFFDVLVAGSGPRKGTDIAYKAFLAAFPERSWGAGPIPRLMMKAPKPQDFFHERLVQINGYLTPQEEVDLYASAHAMIAPARGEGFGLQPLQGLAQGIPTILTDAHGHAGFAHFGYRVGASLVPTAYFMLGDAGEWWEPDLDECVEHLRWVYDHWDSCCADMVTSAQLVARDWTWECSAERFVEAVGEDRLAAPYAGSGEWVTPTERRYLVITNRSFTADMAGGTFHWAAGQRYYELADVKRIIGESGALDPACLDATEPGWDAEEVEQYSARHSHCPTCGVRLGSAPTLADELEAAL